MSDVSPDLNLECNLTIAYRRNCWCSSYFIDRRDVLLPEVTKEAERRGEDAVDVFADYARKVHATKCKTPTAGRTAALFGELSAMFGKDGAR